MKLAPLTLLRDHFPTAITDRLSMVTTSTASRRLQQQLVVQILQLLNKLPDSALFTLLNLINPSPRFPSADPLMQLIMALSNIDPSRSMVTEDVLASRRRFHDSIIALQGSKPKVSSVKDLSFPNRDGQAIPLRLYQSLTPDSKPAPWSPNDKQTPTTSPLIVFFHGGGFALGDIDTHDEVCHYLCHYTGFPVLSVDYRLAPEHPAPAASHDCMDAVIWASQNAETLGVDSAKIIVAGDSAGGNLSAVVCQQLSQSTQWRDCCPVMQWLLYPVTDNKSSYASYQKYDRGTLLSLKDKALFERFYVDTSNIDNSNPLISPMQGKLTALPPAYVAVCELDILSDEGEAYAQALQAKGNLVEFKKIRGMPHGFINMVSIHQGARQATIEMIEQMRAFYLQTIDQDG